jgi:hypothetical protein
MATNWLKSPPTTGARSPSTTLHQAAAHYWSLSPGYVDATPLQIIVPADTGLQVALYTVAAPVQLPPAMMSAPPPDGVSGMVSDATTQASIPGATLQLLDGDGNELADVTTDADCAFTLKTV